MAIRGAAYAQQKIGSHIITSASEHHAVIHTCEWLERNAGFTVTYLKPDAEGIIAPEKVADAITPQTTVVTIMTVNNETGAIQPIPDIARAIRAAENEHGHHIVLHTDAVQAAGYLGLDVQELGADMLSLSAHKFHGPKGVGVLFVDRDAPFQPQTMGGSQERNRRAGTENTPGIVGTGLALQIADSERAEIAPNIAKLSARLADGILSTIPDAHLNGPPLAISAACPTTSTSPSRAWKSNPCSSTWTLRASPPHPVAPAPPAPSTRPTS